MMLFTNTDFRASLSWRGRFAGIANAVNCYSATEDTIQGDYIDPGREYTMTNSADLVVNGTFDLVNFFPVALDLAAFTDAWQARVAYRIRTNWYNPNSFNFCFADVSWSEAGSIQTTNVVTTSGHALSAAPLTALPVAGYSLPYSDITSFSENSGLMICEAKSSSSLRIDIKDGDAVLYTYSVPITLLPVKQMYSWYNFRHLSGGERKRGSVKHTLPEEHNTKSLIFLHGVNVTEDEAEVWGDVLFKRLWLSGAHVDFYNVDWRSNIGSAANYQENASNAFVVASQIVSILTNDIPGEKVVMAHSLGNMVVSSMIQDHGLQVSKYLMCNAAVPAEAYDTTLSPTNVLVHRDWSEYPRKSFANEWYKLFEGDPNDDRQLLTWSGRFADVVNVAVNFYSTDDHVLELYRNNRIWATDGYENWDQRFEHYSWHKQELWKGRSGLLFNIGTTDWAGWSIRENVIQPTNAWLMSGAELKTNTVFKLQPESMNTNSIPMLVRGAILTKGIPARTPASGATKWGDDLNMQRCMFNLGDTSENAMIERPNGWIARPNGLFGNWGERWLHSDMKNMSYFYVFKFFEKLKEVGGLE